MSTGPTGPVLATGRIMYVNDLPVAVVDTTHLTIGAGRCRDSQNLTDIVLEATSTINSAKNGVNGLDTGTIDNDLMYNIFVIFDSRAYNPAAGLISLAASPLLPFGYDSFRRLGSVTTDGSAHFVGQTWRGNGSVRTVWYDALVVADAAITDTSFATISLEGIVPLSAGTAIVSTVFNANAAADTYAFVASGVTSTNGQVIGTAAVATIDDIRQQIVEIGIDSALPAIDAKVSAGTLAVNIAGYVDAL